MFVTTVFFLSLGCIAAMIGFGAIERKIGRRLVFARLRGQSDQAIITGIHIALRTVGQFVHDAMSISARLARAFLAESIVRGRRLSARLRDVAEKRKAAPGSNRGTVSNFLETLAEAKKDAPSKPDAPLS